MALIIIDGSQGEGGGQVLRTSLSLSLITGKPFRIDNIRAKRNSPGLLRQHLTAVTAAARIGSASMEGAKIGSTSLTFIPQTLNAGTYEFAIGTAGSTMLVLQTILLPLALAGGESFVKIEGGTHNPAAPPFDFMERAFLPLVKRMGAEIDLQLIRPGFYPAGGGEIRAHIRPTARFSGLTLLSRGEITERCVRAVVANLAYSIAEREVKVAGQALEWESDCLQAHTLTGSVGPGNAVSVIVGSEHVTDVFTTFGERGVSAEEVAGKVAKQAKRYINSGAAVGEHLADQLLLPMSVGLGGAFTTTPLTNHSMTNIDVIRKFVDVKIDVEEVSAGVRKVVVAHP